MKQYLDRITDAYNGDISEWMMKKSRERINWICTKVTGQKILDVGCSQGIISIILGRDCFEVTGIDIAAESIQFANQCLINEDFSTQRNVRFFCGDFLQLPFEANAYDTVIMTELLEHVDNPEAMVEKCLICLKDNGRVIITVPFGINDCPDHKRTYYLADIYELLSQYFVITDIEFFGKWIGFVADRIFAKGQINSVLDLALLRKEEREFFAIERELVDSNNEKIMGLQKLENLNKQLYIKNTELKQELEQIYKEKNEIEKKFGNAENQCSTLSDENARLLAEQNDMIHERNRLEKEKAEYEKRFEMTEIQREALSTERTKNRKLLAECKIFHQKYDLLAKAKLGRLTIWYWSKKNKFLAQKQRGTVRLKEIAKKIPGIRLLVMKIQGSKFYGVRQSSVVCQSNTKSLHESTVKADEGYFNRIEPMLLEMPESNGGRYYKKLDMRVGIICDQFYYDSIYATADFVYLSPEDWEEKLDQLACLLLVSTWKGLHNEEWRGTITEGSPQRNLLCEIIKKCRTKSIPTIFYSKEDPPNYAHFISIAKKCDYVFTSAEECIPNYVRDCGHNRVYPLCFGINPLFHNPIGLRHCEKFNEVIFSGSWMEKYPERCSDLQIIFDGVLRTRYRLKIINRNFYIKSMNYKFPTKYIPFISPAIDHENLQKVHKLYNWSVNINSVKDSRSMFAARGYELQAAGSLMLSNYSVGLNNLLPLIHIVHNSDEIERILSAYTPEEIYELQITGVRFSLTGETCYDRFAQILRGAGFPTEVQERNVVVIVKEITPRIQEIFDRQSLEKKKLLLEDEVTDEIIEYFDIVAFFDESMDYLEFYLEDMCNGFKYTNSDYITKDAYLSGGKLVDGVEHDFVKRMGCKYRTVFWRSVFTAGQLLGLVNDMELENGYSIDHFNYEAAPAYSESPPRKYKLSVIVPILNDGKRLYGKAFASLRRSSVFSDMQIILVDRGSSDGMTDRIVSYITRRYPNVISYSFDNNGDSITLAEANAKGVALADGDWLVFLNPENEAVGDAYAKLLESAGQRGLDLVIGDAMEFSNRPQLHKNSDLFNGLCNSNEERTKILAAFYLSPVDLQSVLISKELFSRVVNYEWSSILPELLMEAGASMTVPVVMVNIYTLIN